MSVELKYFGEVPFLRAINQKNILLNSPFDDQYAGNFTGILMYRRASSKDSDQDIGNDGISDILLQQEFNVQIIGSKVYPPYFVGYEPETTE